MTGRGQSAPSRRRRGLLATTAALAAASTLVAECGRPVPPPTSSGCGWVYDVTLPGGRHRLLGACAGGFDADAAPTVRMSPGQLLELRVATSLGEPVVRLPTVSSGALTVTSATRTTLTLLATGPGRSVLTAHTLSCSRPSRGSLRSCPVLRVAVS